MFEIGLTTRYISIKKFSAMILNALKTKRPAILLGFELKTECPKSLPRIHKTKGSRLRLLSSTIKRSILNRRLSVEETAFGNYYFKYRKNTQM